MELGTWYLELPTDTIRGMTTKPVLCIVGLGYVGLPLAAAFGRKGYEVYGYDISEKRIRELSEYVDSTKELTTEQLEEAKLHCSTDPAVIGKAEVVILAIPTPVDDANKPDLTLVESASQTVGQNMKKGAIIVYESTVYPGVTEDICGPILAKASGMVCGKDFTLGYSPERINPGDKEHTVDKIMKIVAGQDERTLETLTKLYGSVVTAGIHKASSIKVAEMAKAIENAQRDINIAYINEIAMLCGKIGISSKEVLAAAGTKWNFLKFQPGLVGGHCIGVDPYYLVEKAMMLGVTTPLISASRAINDSMGRYVAEQVIAKLKGKAAGANVLVLGVTFKENIPDTRNSKVADVIKHLHAGGCTVRVHDAHVSREDLERMGMTPGSLEDGPYDAVLLLVPHREYLARAPEEFCAALKTGGVFFDLKGLMDRRAFESAGSTYLSL